MRLDIKETVFWIFLILAMILLLLNVFGNSPTEFFTIIGVIFMLVLKVWSISDSQIKSDIYVKNSFQKVKDDMNLIKKDLRLIKEKLKV